MNKGGNCLTLKLRSKEGDEGKGSSQATRLLRSGSLFQAQSSKTLRSQVVSQQPK